MKDLVRKLHIDYLRVMGGKRPELEVKGQVLIVAPHPDDEVIGCGGLIARLVAAGIVPHIVIMTGGEGSHRSCCHTTEDEIRKTRRRLTRDALDMLGISDSHIHELDFPDGGINDDHSQMERLRETIHEIRPDTVFVPHWGEGWPDHVKTAEIVKSILPTETQVYEYCVWMWYYNVWRGLDWKDAYKLTMSQKEHTKKVKAIEAYVKPLAPCGKPWSGVLPQVFLDANKGKTELYFRVR